jgi:hypothetical protein
MDRAQLLVLARVFFSIDAFLSTVMFAVSAVTYDPPFRVLIVNDNDINRAPLVTVIRQLRDHSIVVHQACDTASRVFSNP